MTSESLAYYLDNAGRLYELNAQELQVMVDTFPYCQNLRYLLLKKSQLDNTSSFDHLLQLAAAYSTDRPFLYQLINERNFYQHPVAEEDVLILNNVPAAPKTPVLDLSILHQATKEAIILENTVVSQPELHNLEIEQIEQTEVPQAANPKLENLYSELNEEDEEELMTFEDLIQAEELENEPAVATSDIPKSEIQNPKSFEEEEGELMTFEDLIQAEEQENEPTVAISHNSKLNYEEEYDDEELTTFEDLIQAEEQGNEPIVATSDNSKLEIVNSKFNDEEDEDELTTFEDLIQAGELDSESIVTTLDNSKLEEGATSEIQNSKSLSNAGIIFEVVEPLASETGIADTAPIVTPMPKASFSTWLKKFHSPYTADEEIQTPKQKAQPKIQEVAETEIKKPLSVDERIEFDLEKKRLKEEKKKKKEALIAFADQSLKRRDDIFSETLAKILAAQGYNARAIEMYEKLKLIFPEKSPYFAAQIEKLKPPSNTPR